MFENSRRRTSKWVVSNNCKVSGYISCLILMFQPILALHMRSILFISHVHCAFTIVLFSRSPSPAKFPNRKRALGSHHYTLKTFHKLRDISDRFILTTRMRWSFYVSAVLLVSHFIFFLLCLSISAKFTGPVSNTTSSIPPSLQISLFLSGLIGTDLLNLPPITDKR